MHPRCANYSSQEKIPPMLSGNRWYQKKWVDSRHQHVWRATLRRLRLVRDPWTSRVNADFIYDVEFYDEDKKAWQLMSPNMR